MAVPTGAAPLPPVWLADRTLPILEIKPEQALHRIHSSARRAVFFGPGQGEPPLNRFDSATGTFGVLYLGLSFAAAFVETLLRNPARRMVRQSDLVARSHCLVGASRTLRMVKMFDDGLSQLGTDNAVSTGPYDPCGAWSDALWLHRDKPDGIAYRSRHDSGELCLAVFARPDLSFVAGDSQSLAHDLAAVAMVLDRYGKSLDQDIS